MTKPDVSTRRPSTRSVMQVLAAPLMLWKAGLLVL